MIKTHLHLKNNRVFLAVTVLSFTAFIFGCSKKDQLPATVEQVKPPVVQQVATPVQKPISSVTKLLPKASGNQFDFSGKKDPFKPFVLVKPVTAQTQAELKKGLKDGLPIHSFDVSQFILIGVVTGGKENQAMVVDPNKKGYVLKVGMSIGKNEGRVTSINSNGVDVLEQFKDDSGRVRRENIRITLPRKQ